MSDRPRLLLIGPAPDPLREQLVALDEEIAFDAVPDAAAARALLAENDPDASAVGAGEGAGAISADEVDALRLRNDAARLVLREVRAVVGNVHHDANNPLAIIAGNAQLLHELARLMQLDDDLLHPIRDIEEASTRLAEVMQRLARLRDSL